ncbi:hypothetical protein [Oryzobacter terrae]|uniref:hypothetical protein n=1 Tax=Oryzobacter terrae TaxID=1620385 RepID=UPI00366F88F1
MARTARAAALGLVLGLVWGSVARGFMRLLATSPEFTWSGTLFIIGTAGLVGALVAVVRSQRLAGRSWWWRLLGLPFVLLFSAAGAIMAPGVAGVVMLTDRRRWLALPGVALVGLTLWVTWQDVEQPLSPRQGAGVLIMLVCLVVEGVAARELVRRWRPQVASAPSETEPAGRVGVPA